MLEIDTGADPTVTAVVRGKELLGMRMPIWYDALQAPVSCAARIARERGARPDAWMAPVMASAGTGTD